LQDRDRLGVAARKEIEERRAQHERPEHDATRYAQRFHSDVTSPLAGPFLG
jgi:hypothetical protein